MENYQPQSFHPSVHDTTATIKDTTTMIWVQQRNTKNELCPPII
jgi:hypothetical protein